MDYSGYKLIRVQKDDGVATATLNRPQSRNAIDWAMHAELCSLWEDVARDEEVRAIVVTGEGQAFSSGGDVRGMKQRLGERQGPELPRLPGWRHIGNLLRVPQPIVAAVNGDAAGLGATLALFCDVIIAAETARIGDPHVRVGLVAGDGGAVIWPLLVGMSKAKYYLMTGDLVSAREAERIGLVTQVVAPDQVMPVALEVARRLANGPTKAIQWTKFAINKVLWERYILNMDTGQILETCSVNTEDHLEAVTAFVEKRAPVFKGK